jgi:putative spermidine/putrescine transport system permease protein
MRSGTLTAGERVWRGLLWAGAGLTFFFLLAPIVAILPLSFNDGQYLTYPLRGLTLRWYEEFFTGERWALSIRNSVVIGVVAALIATVLGTMAALGLSRARFPGKRAIIATLLSPLIVPVIIYAVGLYFFFAPLGLTASYAGLILAHAVLGAPFVVVTVMASLSGFDWTLARAGASLGAGPLRVAFGVIFPMILPGMISGGLFAFSVSLEEVVVILFIAGPEQRTIPREMFSNLRENISPTIAAAAAVLVVVSVALLGTAELLRRRAERLRGIRR